MGNRCNSASPVSEPTARLTQNWMLSWNMLVQEVHSRMQMPNMDVSVIKMLARVAYKYPAKREKEEKKNTSNFSLSKTSGAGGVCTCGLELSCCDALTLGLCEVIRRARFRGACTGSAQDLLDQCWAEPSQAGLTQAWGGRAVVSQMIDEEQLFSRETGLEENKGRHTFTNSV